MYDDYKVVYESKLNEYAIFWIALGIVSLILFVLVLFSTSRILKKAGRSPVLGFIPIYNLIPSLEITNMEKKYFIPLIIPIVNIPFWLMLNLELAKFFKKSKTFGLGMTVLPFIFYPILAFSNSEYIGINLVAMDSTNSVETIPVIDNEKNTLIEKEVNDQMDTNASSISLGGGKYQKDYKKSLLSVEDNMIARGEIQKTKPKETLVTNGKFFNSNIINSNQENEQPISKTPTNDLFNVSFISNTQSQQQPVQQQNPVIQPVQTSQQQPVQPGVIPAVSQPKMSIPSINNNQNINNSTYMQQQPQQSNNQQVDLLKSSGAVAGPRICPNCKTRVADNAKICMICGQKLL